MVAAAANAPARGWPRAIGLEPLFLERNLLKNYAAIAALANRVPQKPLEARSLPPMDEKHEKQFYLSPELAFRLAAIDIGTNSIRLMVVEPLRGGAYRILDEEKESTRLGVSLSKTGSLEAGAMEKSLVALRRMKQIAEGFQVSQLRTIATCAVREARNGDEFRRRAREELGIEIEIISAKREALLAFFSVQKAFDLAGKHVAVADIGGGSTEIVLAYGNLVEAIYTTQLGAVRLAEIHGSGPGMAGDDFQRMVESIDRHLRKHTKNPVFVPHMLFGSGGTFTSLASMVMAAKGQTDLPMRGYQVTRAEVRHLLERLRKQSLRDRAATPGLSPDRADIIVSGLAIVDRVMERFEVNMLQIHNRGVRDGLVLQMIEESLGPDGHAPSDQNAAIDRLVTSCGGEIAHGKHVARMAGLIHEQLARIHATRSPRSAAARGRGPTPRRGISDQLRSASQAQLPLDPAQPTRGRVVARTGADRECGPLPSWFAAQAKAQQLSASVGDRSASGAANGGDSSARRRA